MHDLTGKVALVTGALRRIGGAIALRLGEAGASLAVHYNRNKARAEAVCAAIVETGGRAIPVGGDVSVQAGAEAVVEATRAQLGPIDILVNNAGTLQNLAFGEITPAAFDEQFRSNVLSVILTTQAAAAHFSEQGARVVNVATNLAYGPMPGAVLYSAAKSAIITLTQGFARELGARRVAVNAVAPGATDTAMLDWITDDMRAGIAQATPLGRMGQPDDVADAVVFLASPAARWVNGRTLIVDGGLI